MPEKIVSADKQKLAGSMRRLRVMPEWADFTAHLRDTVAAMHEKQSVVYLAKDRVEDAKRQAWIVEGLLEAADEPDSVIEQYDQENGLLSKIGAFCALCGQKTISAFTAGKKEGKGEHNA